MKTKALTVLRKINNSKRAQRAVATMTTVATMATTTVASAGSADQLLEFIIDILGKGMLAFAAIYAVMGLSKWAGAHADGDGPEMKKAQGTLAAAVIVVVVSIALIASKSQLAGIISAA